MQSNIKIKILLIDDEKLICSSLKRYLETNNDYSVDMAYNGVEALSKLDKQSYDIILTDLNLPDFKDFELIDEIRSRGTDIPVIVMSAQFPGSTDLQIMKHNIFRCITKPFQLEVISDCVTDATRCRVLKSNRWG